MSRGVESADLRIRRSHSRVRAAIEHRAPSAGVPCRALKADEFMLAAIDEARKGRAEGGIPIGSVLVHRGRIIGRGHNRRVQKSSAVLHGEMDALENAGRLAAGGCLESVLYSTLSSCSMSTGSALLFVIPTVS